jgi:hypothetical protein
MAIRPVKSSRAGAKRGPIEPGPFRPACLVLGASSRSLPQHRGSFQTNRISRPIGETIRRSMFDFWAMPADDTSAPVKIGIMLIIGAGILATQVGPLNDKEIRWKRHSL